VFIMSAIAEAVINVAAEAAAHVPARMLRRIAGGIVRIAAMIVYGVGRGLMKLVRAPRSETGVPEAIVGILIVMGLISALIKLPFRLLLETLR
jgi:hypothetical protein